MIGIKPGNDVSTKLPGKGQEFSRILVGRDPHHVILGLVPFDTAGVEVAIS